MKQKTLWQQQYHPLREAVIEAFGGKCFECKIKLTRKTANFAHVKIDEDFTGGSRGSWNRIKDVMKNPFKYGLVCAKCHQERDMKLGMWKWQVKNK